MVYIYDMIYDTYWYLYRYTPVIPISFKRGFMKSASVFGNAVVDQAEWPEISRGEAKRASLAVNNSGAEAACAWCAAKGKSKSANVRTLE